MPLSLEDIERLFAERGACQYAGEPVTQLQHALQTAWLAEQDGANDELVTACLLHDMGHMLNEQGETPSLRGVDDVHQYFALPFLRDLFPARVLMPVKLHVDAKRYLCKIRPAYWAALSEDSKRSLRLQGGIHSEVECQAFIAQAGAADAVALRQWDDAAKQPSLLTPPLGHFLARAERCVISPAAGTR
ncbi:MAG: phosphonate degradation HD-domain oxygenase [Betaproteobacteria bacterium]